MSFMKRISLIVFFQLVSFSLLLSQNDVMLQAFYWDVPVDVENKNGIWWDLLSEKAGEWKRMDITGLWVPPPSKGNWGIIDNGYGVFDHYDLGNYFQKGTVETRFGSKEELLNMLTVMHSAPKIEVYADVVLNHMYGNEEEQEINPAVKEYVFEEAHNGEFTPFETNAVRWVIPDASPGEHHIQIKGYGLNWDLGESERGYNLYINWSTSSAENSDYKWEQEPNNGNRRYNEYCKSGTEFRGFINYKGDVDEYKIKLEHFSDIEIRLEARRLLEGSWEWTDQKNGYYPVAVYYEGEDFAYEKMLAYTSTGFKYVEREQKEPDYTWGFSHFHPSSKTDWLGSYVEDKVVPNTILFGNDLDTSNPEVVKRLNKWGRWLLDSIGFDGFRLDYVRGYSPSFAANWINNLEDQKNESTFIVAEYWGSAEYIKAWVDSMNTYGAIASVFDFPLKEVLTEMCNNPEFNMTRLIQAGLIRNADGFNLSVNNVVTFAENHDTGKENDKWITRAHHLAYAYILTHQGRPCLFYPHLYGKEQIDFQNSSFRTTAALSLNEDICFLIDVRKKYLGGELEVLTKVGNPTPEKNTKNIYVARRNGVDGKDGAILVLNNHSSLAKNIVVDVSPSGFEDWSGQTLINLQTGEEIQVGSDGRAKFSSSPLSYSIWIKKEVEIRGVKGEIKSAVF